MRTQMARLEQEKEAAMSNSILSKSSGRLLSQIIPLTSPQAAQKAAQALKSGHVIATPTDTIYGIAASVQNNAAVNRLYEIKGRDSLKPIAICLAEIDQVYDWGRVTVERSVLEALLPGPVTVIFRRLDALNPKFNPGTDRIGIRIPDHAFVRNVCRLCEVKKETTVYIRN